MKKIIVVGNMFIKKIICIIGIGKAGLQGNCHYLSVVHVIASLDC